jgi:hypothetical protein|eukprot:CAMPEP_0169104960 /NCGR_PEP_ID=MMETSP1015-20121227/23538_1 /TAXON_ID=342587 /ORGANISM="Karlodinium micrum, Strain CCMP2283" /LENGTH=289 /DNA_ID=CAMNT_0009166281 /DNA_START=54 /DNA_END=923 /DNA_ORIENTATION=+
MSLGVLLAIFVAPACSQLVIRLGPVDEDHHSNLKDVAVPGGFMMAKSLPDWQDYRRSVQQSPLEDIVQQLMAGVSDERDEPSPEQMLQDFMMNGLQRNNLFRRSRLGFSRPPQEQMLQNLMTNAFGDDNMFSLPSLGSSSFSRTHTISDGDGRVEVKQTQCQDGFCITSKSASSPLSSFNPFVKIKTLRAMQPKDLTDTVSAPCHEEVGMETPEVVEEDEKVPTPEKSEKETLVQDLAEFASVLEKGIEAAADPNGKDGAAVVTNNLKEQENSVAALANKLKEEHVMEV